MQLERATGGRVIAPRRPRRGGRVYSPDDVLRCSYGGLDLGMGLDSSQQRPHGSDLRDFVAAGEALACWELWNPSQVNYAVGPGEQLSNGGFESGTTGWIDVSCVLEIVAGSFGVGGGTKYGKIKLTAPTSSGYTYAPGLTAGARYLYVGYAQGDGNTGYPQLRNGATILWTGTTSAATQPIVVDFTAAVTTLRLYTQSTGAVDAYSKWDNGSLIELPGIVKCPNIWNPGTYDLDFTLGAQQAWLHPLAWLGMYPAAAFDGVAHWGAFDALVAAHYTGNDKPLAAILALQGDGVGAGDYPLSFGNSVSATHFQALRTAAGPVWEAVKAIPTDSATNTTATAATDNPATVAWKNTGTAESIWVDKTATSVAGAACDIAAITLDRGTVGALGRTGESLFFPGFIREIALLKVADDAAMRALELRMRARNHLS